MSMNNLSIDGEFRYIIQWFNEWSELQRDDFVPVLVEYLQQSESGEIYMNGVVNSVAEVGIQDKPMSLFQCRIKLFREWNKKWPSDLKHKLREKVSEIDSKVGEKITNEIKSNGGELINGTTNGYNGEEAVLEIPIESNVNNNAEHISDSTADGSNEAVEASIHLDSQIVAALNNETPVDDNTTHENTENETADTTTMSTAAIATDIVNSPIATQLQLEPDEQVHLPTQNALEENVIVADSIATTTVA
uniref:Uncharacterized protein n=1 Tax=Ceratitis capitata TaxID=7213 RepID=W8CDF3_CERCA